MTYPVTRPYLLNSEMRGIGMANQKLKPVFKDGKVFLEIPEEMVSYLGLNLSPYYFEYRILGDAILLKAKVDAAELLDVTDEQLEADDDGIDLDIK